MLNWLILPADEVASGRVCAQLAKQASLIIMVFVEQPLASPGAAKHFINTVQKGLVSILMKSWQATITRS